MPATAEAAAGDKGTKVCVAGWGWVDARLDGTMAHQLQAKHACSGIRLEIADEEELASLALSVGAVPTSAEAGRRKNLRKKVSCRHDTGQVCSFNFDAQLHLFYRVSNDRTLVLLVDDQWVDRWVTTDAALPTEDEYGTWNERLAANLTGKHQSRRRVVKVPTRAGEPARG